MVVAVLVTLVAAKVFSYQTTLIIIRKITVLAVVTALVLRDFSLAPNISIPSHTNIV